MKGGTESDRSENEKFQFKRIQWPQSHTSLLMLPLLIYFTSGVQKSVFPVNQVLFAEREDSMNALWGPTVMAPVRD